MKTIPIYGSVLFLAAYLCVIARVAIIIANRSALWKAFPEPGVILETRKRVEHMTAPEKSLMALDKFLTMAGVIVMTIALCAWLAN